MSRFLAALLLALLAGLGRAQPAEQPPLRPEDTPALEADEPLAPEAEPAFAPQPITDWLAAQVELHRRGFSCGSLDGVRGLQTATALKAWQKNEGLRETGDLDRATKEALLLTAPVLADYIFTAEDLASLSPKLLNSAPDPIEHAAWRKRHEATRWQPDVVRAWIDQYPYQFKFVVSRPADLEEMESMLAALRREIPRHKVLLMPEATSPERMRSHAAWLGELCKAHGYRYGHRLHLELYGHRRGT